MGGKGTEEFLQLGLGTAWPIVEIQNRLDFSQLKAESFSPEGEPKACFICAAKYPYLAVSASDRMQQPLVFVEPYGARGDRKLFGKVANRERGRNGRSRTYHFN